LCILLVYLCPHAITCSFLIITGCSGISRWDSLKNSSQFFTLNDEPWGQILNHFLVMCLLPTCHTEEEWDQEGKVSKRKNIPSQQKLIKVKRNQYSNSSSIKFLITFLNIFLRKRIALLDTSATCPCYQSSNELNVEHW